MSNIKKYFLNSLIVFYLAVIYFTGTPPTNTLNERLKNNLQPIAFAFGIWPSWSMFAPNPIKFDSKTFAQYEFADGSKSEEDVEPELTGILEPFRKARWMKYSQDNIRNPKQSALRPPLARYLKAKAEKDGKGLKKLVLIRRWEDVHPLYPNAPLVPLLDKRERTKHSEVLYEENFAEVEDAKL